MRLNEATGGERIGSLLNKQVACEKQLLSNEQHMLSYFQVNNNLQVAIFSSHSAGLFSFTCDLLMSLVVGQLSILQFAIQENLFFSL